MSSNGSRRQAVSDLDKARKEFSKFTGGKEMNDPDTRYVDKANLQFNKNSPGGLNAFRALSKSKDK
jgi:hypothetical protein